MAAEVMSRISSFQTFPRTIDVFTTKLASAGFFYTGNDGIVQCVSCRFQFKDWQSINSIRRLHKEHSPNCHLVADDHSETNKNSETTKTKSQAPSTPKPEKQSAGDQRDGNVTARPAIIQVTAARYPQYADFYTRLASFTEWPAALQQTPNEIANAGFFYTGIGDTVKCYTCGGGLKDWEEGDLPWVEHAAWFPRCEFVRKSKGGDYIQQVQLLKQTAIAAQANSSTNTNHGDIPDSFREENPMPNVQQRQLEEDILLSPAVLSVLEMGYSRETVLSAVRTCRQTEGQATMTAVDIMNVLLLNDYEPKPQIPRKRNFQPAACKNMSPSSDQKPIDTASPSLDNLSLEDENKQLRDKTLCKICFDEKSSIVFLPCGHLCTCASCSAAMRNCPICRQYIKGTVKTYLA